MRTSRVGRAMSLAGALISLAILLLMAWLTPAWARGPGSPGAVFQVEAETDPWPMLGGDAAHSGLAAGPAAPYREVWSAPNLNPAAGPVVAADVVVVIEARRVVALDRDTGRQVWEADRQAGPAGPPAVADGLAIFGEGRGEEAAISAAMLTSGEPSWTHHAGANVVGGLTVNEGRVLAGTAGGMVLALSAESGDLLWEHRAPGRVDSAPAVVDDTVYVASENYTTGLATVAALDASTGSERWRFSPSGPALGVSSVSVTGDLAVAGMGDFRIYGFDGATGRERWHRQARAPFSARLAPALVTAGPVEAMVVGDRGGHLYRLEPATGELLWTFRVPGTMLESSPVIVGETVVVGDDSGQVSAIDLSSGVLVWKSSMGQAPIGAVASDGERLYVAVQRVGGRVAALEHNPDGQLLAEPSPTTLFLGRALLNYAIASAAVGLILVGIARLARRPPVSAPSEEEEPDDSEDREGP